MSEKIIKIILCFLGDYYDIINKTITLLKRRTFSGKIIYRCLYAKQ